MGDSKRGRKKSQRPQRVRSKRSPRKSSKDSTEKAAHSLADLRPDPNNARRHTPASVAAITDALHEVGAARSIVIDEANVVLCGNATIEAAADAGIHRVRIIDADGEEIIAVRRSGLTDEQKTRLALFDNRAAELAEWDDEELKRLAAADFNFAGIFTDAELAKLISGAVDDDDEGDDDKDGGYREQHGVIVMCRSEDEQRETYERLTADGYTCRVVST